MKRLLASSLAALLLAPAAAEAQTYGTYNASPPTLADGQQSPLQLDSTGNLRTTGGGGGGGSNAAAGPTGSAPPTSASYTGFQSAGGNLVGVSPSNPLPTTASLAGSTSNGTDGQATSTTNIGAVSYNYGWNGTTWDRLKATGGQLQVLNYGSGGLLTQGVATAGTGSLNVYLGGSVFSLNGGAADAGTLRVVNATGSTVIATQATAANLNATVVGGVAQASTFNTTTAPIVVGGCTTVTTGACSAGTFNPASFTASGYLNVVLQSGALVVGKVGIDQTTPGSTNGVSLAANTNTTAAVSTASAQNATAVSAKAAAGNVYGYNVVNSTVAGYILILNLTAAPTSGTAVTAAQTIRCVPLAANVGADVAYDIPRPATTGVVITFSTSCTSYTAVATAPVLLAVDYK